MRPATRTKIRTEALQSCYTNDCTYLVDLSWVVVTVAARTDTVLVEKASGAVMVLVRLMTIRCIDHLSTVDFVRNIDDGRVACWTSIRAEAVVHTGAAVAIATVSNVSFRTICSS